MHYSKWWKTLGIEKCVCKMLQKFTSLSMKPFLKKVPISSAINCCSYSVFKSLQITPRKLLETNLANFHSRHLSYLSEEYFLSYSNAFFRRCFPKSSSGFRASRLFCNQIVNRCKIDHRIKSHPFTSDVVNSSVKKLDNVKLFHLKSRSLIHLVGTDTSSFLQGLITNDMQQFQNDNKRTMYAMILNVQGRILYDIFIYALPNQSSDFFLECDTSIINDLIKLLKRYKIRKKVSVENTEDKFQVWASFSPPLALSNFLSSEKDSKVEICEPDPRVQDFGSRLILPHDTSCVSNPEEEYHMRRYEMGIAEGTSDLPPGSCFPLENNLVFLNGVSFQKGCYIGQELTARTHHRGVIRKRLMPIFFQSEPGEIMKDKPIVDSTGKNIGKFRGNIGKHGLALLQLKPALQIQDGYFDLDNHKVKPKIPAWWPNLNI
ncbi:putative transferase CAF17 homolog, mitochondrial isoform X2 [Octopus bimaculoides]|uniref:putative transferase CAF17 homolog, mitochondrial isoform X2 n=1 Tax=Octopus bimaculoides TaxID=37653 RepID=UPI00071E296A|nr:putative transferase CAF17 homolog, mitochondrial isoform X2 [Octopus bimaculoides]|eukprot:XP_014779538.1 PREDICTED: putative transferase CAF17 homolog, mitochondrial isoform X2 [Octopus bimaculoides]